jgi:hypothetical protein
MRLIDFLLEYGEALEDEKEQQKKRQNTGGKRPKVYKPRKRHR